MTFKTYRLPIALLCAALLCAPLHAASGEERKEGDAKPRAEEKSERAQKKPSRFETCKRDARGKDGSERATFMTECLHDRHN